jgi:hypothetical protein
VALGQVFPEYFGFPCQFSFHLLLHTRRLSSGAGTIGKILADVPSGLSLTPLQETKKKKLPLHQLGCNRYAVSPWGIRFESLTETLYRLLLLKFHEDSYAVNTLSYREGVQGLSRIRKCPFRSKVDVEAAVCLPPGRWYVINGHRFSHLECMLLRDCISSNLALVRYVWEFDWIIWWAESYLRPVQLSQL